MTRLTLCLLIGIISCIAAEEPAKAPTPDVTVEAIGLRVVAPLPNSIKEENLRAFNWSPGTTVVLLINAPSGGLVQFDHKSSALTKFIDGKGSDLLAAPKTEGDTKKQGFFG